MRAITTCMLFDSKRRQLAEKIAPAVESVGNAATAVIGLTVVSLLIAVAALLVAVKTQRSMANG